MAMLEERLKRTLNKFLSPIVAKTILTSRLTATNIDLYNLRIGDRQRLADALKKGAGRYLKPEDRKKCFLELDDILIHSGSSIPSPPMRMSSEREQKIEINNEIDIVTARGVGRQMCADIGFSASSQVKMATAISELARNIVQYAGKGEVTIKTGESKGKQYLFVSAADNGPGIKNIQEILAGHYRSKSGMGKGLTGTRNMVDEFDINSSPDSGTRVDIRKWV